MCILYTILRHYYPSNLSSSLYDIDFVRYIMGECLRAPPSPLPLPYPFLSGEVLLHYVTYPYNIYTIQKMFTYVHGRHLSFCYGANICVNLIKNQKKNRKKSCTIFYIRYNMTNGSFAYLTRPLDIQRHKYNVQTGTKLWKPRANNIGRV